ncbi:MAG: substrate-binding domain-containing protein [Chitinophagaceae bacterium]|nr:substrate-binding domain-containing protein [Chitinophagaceae bacterium]
MTEKIFVRILTLLIVAGFFYSLTGCRSGNTRPDLDSADSGTIRISVDESFRPLIDSEIRVYEALHPKTKIIAEYKPEGECFKDLDSDSTRMIIVTRSLTTEEERYYKEKYYSYPVISRIAFDAIAVVVKKGAPDSIFYKADLKSIINGDALSDKKVIFDGAKGSSVFRYIQDSLMKGGNIDTSRVFAVDGSEEVLKRVEENSKLIGMVGVSWIGNPEDTTQTSFLERVSIASLECRCPEDVFVKPYQANIALGRYPFTRGLYFILRENYSGLGSAFGNFLESERGQLIINRAYLVPGKVNLSIRKAEY